MGCMYWTKEVADAIHAGPGGLGLTEYAAQCTDELMKVVNKVGGWWWWSG